MNKIIKTLQELFSNIFEVILNNKYFKALFYTFLILFFIVLFIKITILVFKVPAVGILLIFAIVYFLTLSEL